MNKPLLSILFPTTLLLSGQMQAQTKMMVFSDPHVLTKSLYDASSQSFTSYYESEQKSELYSQDLFETALSKVKTEKPDVLLIVGDLTKDGEKASHQYVSGKLNEIVSQGIKVLVIPGNHDIDNPYASQYLGDTSEKVSSISESEFTSLYASCGYSSAVKKHSGSLSYMCYPNDQLAVICLDSTIPNKGETRNSAGGLTESVLQWVETVAWQARATGRYVIAMMHHPIVEHFDYQMQLDPNHIANAGYGYPSISDTQGRLIKAGVNVMFTGHFHIQSMQHVTTTDGELLDVSTGSLCCYTSQLRSCTLSQGGLLSLTSQTVATNEILAAEKKRNEKVAQDIINVLSYRLYAKMEGYKSSAYASFLALPESIEALQADLTKYLKGSYTDLLNALYAGDEDKDNPDAKYKACQKAFDAYLLSVCKGNNLLLSVLKSMAGDYLNQMDDMTKSILYNYVGTASNVVPDNAHTFQLSRQPALPLASDDKCDVNNDKQVTTLDVPVLRDVLLGRQAEASGRADVNCNGKISISDLTSLIHAILMKR